MKFIGLVLYLRNDTIIGLILHCYTSCTWTVSLLGVVTGELHTTNDIDTTLYLSTCVYIYIYIHIYIIYIYIYMIHIYKYNIGAFGYKIDCFFSTNQRYEKGH